MAPARGWKQKIKGVGKVFIHPSECYFYCGHVNRATFGFKKKEIKTYKIKKCINCSRQPRQTAQKSQSLGKIMGVSISSVFCPAVPAVNRFALGRLERNLALSFTLGAGRLVHLARSKIPRPTEPSTICHFILSFIFFRYNSKKQLGRSI